MDFIDPIKTRAHTTRLLVGYVLIGIAIFLATLILVFVSYGYSYDTKSGEVVQKGLVFVEARPESMDVYLNGGLLRERTTARLLLPTGKYSLELKKTGYRPWKNDFNLEGANVLRYDYPLLFPNDLRTKEVKRYDAQPSVFSESPDRKQLVISHPEDPFVFDIFNSVDKTTPLRTIAIPASLASNPAERGTIKLIEWSNDNRHFLMERNFADLKEFYVIDTLDVALSVNVNTLTGLKYEKVTLNDKRADKLFAVTSEGSVLRSIDTKAKVVSNPLLSGITAYKTFGQDTIFYCAVNVVTKKVEAHIFSGQVSYLVREYPESSECILDVAKYDNKWYFIIASKTDTKAYVYVDPIINGESPSVKAVLQPNIAIDVDRPQFVTFSANTRFISVQQGKNFGVYDNELKKKYQFQLDEEIPEITKARWMDGYHLALSANGRSLVLDFDGTNKQALAPSINDIEPLFDRDYVSLFTLISVEGKVAITRSELVAPVIVK